MSGSHHVWTHLVGGPVVVADYREKVVPAMRRYSKRVVVDREEPRPSDTAAIMAWYAANSIQSANCQAGVCDHVVD